MPSDWTSDRLNEPLMFKMVSEGPPRYANSTNKAVEFYTVVNDYAEVTGYLWICDADDAASFERRLASRSLNAGNFWYAKLLGAKSQGLSPTQAVQELSADPGHPFDGHIVPDSKAVAASVAAVRELAAEGWKPPKQPVPPLGYLPDPPITDEQREAAAAGTGWLYKVDEGYDPSTRVPSNAVEGAWQVVNPRAALVRFWHNPAYGSAPATASASASGEASPVPPLRAGRRPAGRALLDWLEDPQAPRLCRVAGSSGSGRTHLLTWLAAACPADNPHIGRRVHASLCAEGLTVRSATWLLAARLGVVARTPTDLMEALQDGTPRALVVTDLDRAGGDLLPDMPERIAAELLTPLLQVPWLRLLVETAEGTPAAAALHAAAPGAAVLDLDDPCWTDRERFAAWCTGLGGYPVAAAQVYPSPGLAQLAARTSAGAGLDPDIPPADRASALVGAWWAVLPDELRPAVRTLATAGEPVTLAAWAALPDAGGPEAVHRAAGYLPPPTDGRTWRLRPDQLARQVDAGSPPVDHAALVGRITAGLPRTGQGRPDPAGTAPDWLGLLLRHAVRAGAAEQFLTDPEFLVHADAPAVTAALDHAEAAGSPQDELARAWHLAGPVIAGTADPTARAAALHAWLAGRDQESADRLAARSGQGWRALWSYPADDERVHRAAPGAGPFAGLLAVALGRAVGFIELETGQNSRKTGPFRPRDRWMADLACGDDGGVYVLDRKGVVTSVPLGGDPGPPTDAAEGLPKDIDNGVSAIATLSGDEGRLLAVGDGGGGVLYAQVDVGRILKPDQPLHQGRVTGVDLTRTDGGVLVVSGGADGRVWSWMHGRSLMQDPIDARDSPVTAVAVASTPQGLLIASAWADGLVRLRRWGATPAVVDLRLGLPAGSLVIDPTGLVCLALPEGVLGLTLD
ncbi:hypothetical protein [Saccharothrix sp. ST-888]|uniref:hypothetical protein n=1 Tax=Saccharothrix sp. ST-888 TaxID=1427391 RepID=UPI000698A830|nr:hypothetical protein [Saccharothrix sp. ST-888]